MKPDKEQSERPDEMQTELESIIDDIVERQYD